MLDRSGRLGLRVKDSASALRRSRSWTLNAVQEPGDSALFILFRDVTSGTESYPAGRYLSAPAPDTGDLVVLDFNRSYNPPCAFTAFATCPLPPRQNVLPIAIRAGERRYAGGHANVARAAATTTTSRN